MTWGAYRRLQRGGLAPLSGDGGERAGADRVSCGRQCRRHHRRGLRPQDRVQPHAQDGHLDPASTGRRDRLPGLLLAVVFGACCLLLAAFIGSLLYMVRAASSAEAARASRREQRAAGDAAAARRRAAARRGADPVLQRGAGAAARRRGGGAARLAARQAAHPDPRRQHRRDGRDRAHRGGRAARARASTSWPCSAPTARATRAARCTRRCSRRRTTTSRSSTSTTCRRPDFLRRCMRGVRGRAEGGLRAGALRLPQSARERADRDADGDARRPSRHRAGDALLGRPSAAVQRHLRHLAARRDRGRRRLEGRHRHRGPRPHLSRLGQGLARGVPDQRRRARRAAGRHPDLAAPAAALAGRLPPRLAAHVPGDPEEPRHRPGRQGRGAAASLHVAQPAGAAGRRGLRHPGRPPRAGADPGLLDGVRRDGRPG